MEDAYDALAHRALSLCRKGVSDPSRVLIGVAGVPGGGKSTLANEVCRRINKTSGKDVAVNVPMDGFHYYRRELNQMPDPKKAYARRGGHWTFDAEAYVNCLKNIKFEAGEHSAPSFDHGVGDPAPDAITILPGHKIVISEGNYLLLDDQPWSDLFTQGILDDTWYVDCDVDTAMHRVFMRQTGNGVAPEVSLGRIDGNDRPNAELIERTKNRAALRVPSMPFKNPPKEP